MMPPALGRLSAITCCFQVSVIFWPMTRADTSTVLPAEKPMTTRIGREGYVDTGSAAGAAAGNAAAATRTAPAAHRAKSMVAAGMGLVLVRYDDCRMRAYHDLGGTPAGPVEREEHELALWEKRI